MGVWLVRIGRWCVIRSSWDPDSRLVTHGSGGGAVQGYNTQIAVTDDRLILGIHGSQDGNDTGCFEPTLQAAQATTTELGLTIGTVLADAGYFTDHNLTLPGPDRLIAPGRRRACLRCPMPIASDLHDALWATFVVQALPAGPQHCHPRARVPVPGCSEVSQPGLPSCLMGCR